MINGAACGAKVYVAVFGPPCTRNCDKLKLGTVFYTVFYELLNFQCCEPSSLLCVATATCIVTFAASFFFQDIAFGVLKMHKKNYLAAPRTSQRSPSPSSWWGGASCPLPKNPTPALGPLGLESRPNGPRARASALRFSHFAPSPIPMTDWRPWVWPVCHILYSNFSFSTW